MKAIQNRLKCFYTYMYVKIKVCKSSVIGILMYVKIKVCKSSVIGILMVILFMFCLLLCIFLHRCVVCISEFEAGEDIRTLLPCNHDFHQACVDRWLLVRGSLGWSIECQRIYVYCRSDINAIVQGELVPHNKLILQYAKFLAAED